VSYKPLLVQKYANDFKTTTELSSGFNNEEGFELLEKL